MFFPTLVFLVFFLTVHPVSWALIDRPLVRKLFLIAASYVFYAWWDWRFAGLLLLSTLINYLGGLGVAALRDGRGRKWVLGLTVALNLAILGFFKYYEFFITSLGDVLRTLGIERDLPLFQVILPVGISFFTFQGISYVADVYRKRIPVARSFPDVMLYISFFPQLVAGPIVRAEDFMPQLQKQPDRRNVLVSMGLLLILWGLFKKAIVANYLAVDLVDKVFFDPVPYNSFELLIGIYGYAIQIYCDFSAYSDIAIGVAALLGYSFPRNFDQPYRSRSIAEFWRRWHISLSSWLRDYLYIPLGGNRKGRVRTYVNLSLTMLLGGLWHGAAWKFVIWGALHGGGLAAERMVTGLRKHAQPAIRPPILAIILVFHFVCFAWIFFRAKDMEVVGMYLSGLVNNWSEPLSILAPLPILLIVVGLAINFTPRDMLNRIERRFDPWPLWAKGLFCGLVVTIIEAFGMDGAEPFIYFQF